MKQKSSVKVSRRSRVRHITQHSRCGTLRAPWSPGEETGKPDSGDNPASLNAKTLYANPSRFEENSYSIKGRDSLIRIAFLNELTGALAEDRSCLKGSFFLRFNV
ncbi:hypothetical protein ABIE66_004726 [Peribacillus sp. B2I2]|uniref:hypothetical protein n=1 Tax=Peribacillus sp. B2I2 TaxID=3156468 RepID=UPI00351474AC